ncbi:penicillin-binding protein 2 [Chitiniphilus purpureus]|uniref:Peptidoglycan D,D-transpeptidase FtsI n=1 Tax=Chitiniphilus purpureus TaxID=2981137 RepID=A0ABY6DMM0_9NEIS|nr:penicillin-binding protein 2 [Chitiniphilus sp. CD1]UXY15589.1 penicillin-binding protein 2 [Chitiniphilus sp. CD1]
MQTAIPGRSRQRYAQQLKLERWRVWLIVGGLMLLFAILLARAFYLQVLNEGFLQQQGEARYARTLKLEANRGMITDRNGEPLAISTPVQSIWASPRSIKLLPPGQKRPAGWEPSSEKEPVPVSREELARLAKAVDLPLKVVQSRLATSRKGSDGRAVQPDFVWLRRHMAPQDARKVLELNLPGVYAQTEYRRYYPAGEVTAHIIGFTNIDGRGQEGFELTRQDMLAGKAGSRTVIRDRRGYIVEDISTIVPPKDGETLTLSIDRRIQYLAYRELKAAVEANKALGGGIVVLDARTGEVLALANVPSYNPNSRTRIDPARRRNRAVTDLYEPGSTMKPITVAAALESGKFTPSTVIDTGAGAISMAGFTIKDTHAYGPLSVEGVLVKSSNVGTTRIALSLEREYLWRYYNAIGFGQPPRTGFPGEASGRLRAWKTWRPVEQATMSYGYGLSVSLMQMARAYQVFATDGQIRPVTFTRQVAPLPGRRVFTPEVAATVRLMMEKATQPGGTGTRAQVIGYRVAGKTGTAKKVSVGGYVEKKYVGSFVGFAPVSDPRLIVAVMIDEPRGESYYGGTVAGPAFANVVAGSLRMLGVPPDAPTDNILLPGQDVPEVPEET